MQDISLLSSHDVFKYLQGMSNPDKKLERVSFRMATASRQSLKAAAEKRKRTESAMIVQILESWLRSKKAGRD